MNQNSESQIFLAFDEGLEADHQQRMAILARYFPTDPSAQKEVHDLWEIELEEAIQPISDQALALLLTDTTPKDFGDFEELDYLGKGGMGVVYRARQKSLDRMIAIKTLHDPYADQRSKQRFDDEIRHLAAMSHPNIATIHGFDYLPDSRPFFYMEYLQGESLDEWCRHQSWRACIDAFIEVCAGVAHAHSKGILHCDLKPSNILVVNGTPKLIDFGLAVLTENGCLQGGTPTYMAPELLAGKRPDTRSDIYALGKVFQKILVDDSGFAKKLPHRQELLRVFEKATKTHADARYGSCLAMGQDLQAYLDCEPLQACGNQWPYRFRKWLQRHPFKLVITALLCVALGFVGAERIKREQERNAAKREMDAFSHFLKSTLASSSALNYGQDIPSYALLHNNLKKLENFQGSRLSKAVLCRRLGLNFVDIGSYDEAERLFNQALRLIGTQLEPTAPQRLDLVLDLAYLDQERGRLFDSEKGYREALWHAETSDHNEYKLKAKSGLATTLGLRGLFLESETFFKEVNQNSSVHEPLRLLNLENLGSMYRQWGKYNQAVQVLEEAREYWTELKGELHPRTLSCRQQILFVQADQGHRDLGEQENVWRLRREVLGEGHPESLESLNTYANMHGNRNPLAAIALLELGLGEAGDLKHPIVLRMRHNLGHWLMAIDPEKAELVLRQTFAMRKALLGARHQDTLKTACTLAETLLAQDCLYEAETLFEATHRLAKASLGEDHPDSLVYQALLGVTLKNQGRQLEAQPMIQASYDGLKAAGSGHARWVGREL